MAAVDIHIEDTEHGLSISSQFEPGLPEESAWTPAQKRGWEILDLLSANEPERS